MRVARGILTSISRRDQASVTNGFLGPVALAFCNYSRVVLGTVINYRPHIDIRAKDGTCSPWQPSQDSLMASDWETVS